MNQDSNLKGEINELSAIKILINNIKKSYFSTEILDFVFDL